MLDQRGNRDLPAYCWRYSAFTYKYWISWNQFYTDPTNYWFPCMLSRSLKQERLNKLLLCSHSRKRLNVCAQFLYYYYYFYKAKIHCTLFNSLSMNCCYHCLKRDTIKAFCHFNLFIFCTGLCIIEIPSPLGVSLLPFFFKQPGLYKVAPNLLFAGSQTPLWQLPP